MVEDLRDALSASSSRTMASAGRSRIRRLGDGLPITMCRRPPSGRPLGRGPRLVVEPGSRGRSQV